MLKPLPKLWWTNVKKSYSPTTVKPTPKPSSLILGGPKTTVWPLFVKVNVDSADTESETVGPVSKRFFSSFHWCSVMSVPTPIPQKQLPPDTVGFWLQW